MTKQTVIREFGSFSVSGAELFDLTSMEVRRCTGCWSCWMITPGKCVFKDLDSFYHAYVTSDNITFFLKPEKGFVSVGFKKLIDRMCPLFLPYCEFAHGGSWHTKRYERYPDVTVYYEDNFSSDEECSVFCDYVRWVFVQFHSDKVIVKPISEFTEVK